VLPIVQGQLHRISIGLQIDDFGANVLDGRTVSRTSDSRLGQALLHIRQTARAAEQFTDRHVLLGGLRPAAGVVCAVSHWVKSSGLSGSTLMRAALPLSVWPNSTAL
jgi:hypothetical protein